MEILIRTANKKDIDSIYNLLKELYETIEDKSGLDIEKAYEKLEFFISNDNNLTFVAECEGNIVGFISVFIRKTILHTLPSALIEELVVDKNYRGKGIGKRLIEAVIKKCEELNIGEIEVSTEITNINAREFYKSMGFKEKGILLEMDL